MPIATYGTNSVDWEERINNDRLRTERLANLRAHLEASEVGGVDPVDTLPKDLSEAVA